MKKKVFAALLCVILIFSFGCNKSDKKDNDSGTKKIVTSFYPMYIFTTNLTKGIENVTVTNITQQTGGCLHDYQLLPKDLVTLNDAVLFVTNGAGMESFMDKVSDQLPDLKVVSASDGIELLKDEHHHDDSEDEDAHEGHDHGEYNSHVWLSIPNAIIQVENIASSLKEILPDDADKIESNKQEYIKQLKALDAEIAQELKPYSGASIITFHEAFDYFANQYGLSVVDTIETEDGAEPSAKELSELAEEIKEKNVKALFVEPEYKGTSANVLATETGLKVYTLNPITSGKDELTAYEDIMRDNLKVLKEAFSA